MIPTSTSRRSRRTVRPERADVRERVLAAGREVFAEVGYQKATLDAIAARAGFSKGAVYSNFAGKDDLFLTLLKHEVADMRAVLDAAPGDGSLADDVRLLAATVLGWARDGRAQLVFAEFRAHAAHDPALARRTAEVRAGLVESTAERLAEVVAARGGRLTVPATDAATLLLALVNGLALEHVGRADVVAEDSLVALMSGLVA
ncbi:TetR/AcrR family transcriptional regulator [Nocardioides halotolerans]|uniref:TetR/AcrR family transcriptional regulator n=1 Tax=Nocardioides halotolerans TaxID=433660 RepID=UPI000426E0C1|nr:TetR/AcrR family transcriptional regulator [Nocardioides halotolerans]